MDIHIPSLPIQDRVPHLKLSYLLLSQQQAGSANERPLWALNNNHTSNKINFSLKLGLENELLCRTLSTQTI